MSNAVLDFVRSQDPELNNADDDALTLFLGDKDPGFLDDAQFAERYALVKEKQKTQQGTPIADFVAKAADYLTPLIYGMSAKGAISTLAGNIGAAGQLAGAATEALAKVQQTGSFKAATMPLPEVEDRVVVQAARGIGELAPALGAMAAGVPAPVALGAGMAANEYSRSGDVTRSMQAAGIGMAFPATGEVGSVGGELLAGRVAARLGLGEAATGAAMTAGKIVGAQSMYTALMVAGESEHFSKLLAEDPDAAREELTKLMLVNLVFEVPRLPQLAREALARDHVQAWFKSPDYREVLDTIKGKEMDVPGRPAIEGAPEFVAGRDVGQTVQVAELPAPETPLIESAKPLLPRAAAEVESVGKAAEMPETPTETVRPVQAPETPSAATAKIQSEIADTAKTEGARSAKDIKSELVARLEEAIANAPSEADVKQKFATKVSGERYESSPDAREKITIEIPGDGTFTVWNTKENLEGLLKRAKRIATTPFDKKPAKIKEPAQPRLKDPVRTRLEFEQELKKTEADLEDFIALEDEAKIKLTRERLVELRKRQPEMVGMGAAVTAEFEPSFRTSTGIKKEAVAEARAERGLEPIDAPPRAPQEQAAAEMKQKLYDDPAYFDLLVDELTNKPRAINSNEVLALDIRYVQLQDEYGRATREGEQAQADGRTDAVIEALRKADFWDAKLAEFEKMVRATGTHWGRTGAMMRRRMRADFTLEKMEARARHAKGFEPLTPDERAQIKILHEEITAKDKAIAEREERLGRLEAEKAVLEAKAETEKAPEYSPAVMQAAERFVQKLEAKSSEYLKEVLGATWTPGPELIYKLSFIGATKLARTGLDVTRWTAEMIATLGERVRPYLAEIYEKSKAMLESQIAEAEKGFEKSMGEKVRKAVKKEDVEGRIAASKEKISATLEDNDLGNITPQVKKLAEALWAKGIREVNPMIDELQAILKEFMPEITRQETMDALSGRGRFWQGSQDEIKKGVRDLSAQARLIAHQIDVEAKRPLPRTGYQPDPMSDAARREQQRLNELKKQFGVVVTDPAKQLASALQASKTYLRHRLADLREEIATRQKIVKTKTPLTPDAELEALRKEYEQVRKEHSEIFQKPEVTDEQRLKLALAAAERAEAAWGQRLANARKGDFSSLVKPGKKITSAELKAIQARTEAVKEQVKELKELAFPKKTPAELALQSALTRTRNAIADRLERMAKSDFSKRPQKPPINDPELLRLKGDLEKIKEQFRAREERFKWDQLNIFQKAGKGSVMVWDAMRVLMTTGEFSFVLRQGKFFAMSRPATVAKAIPEMLKAFASERNARASELAIRESPDYEASQAAKLHISREGDSLSRQEEIVMGRWSNAIPIARNFNRAATTFLNRLRYDSWLAMRKSMSRFGKPTPAEDRMYARMANEATGRGELAGAEPAAVALGRVLFAPRYLASRIEMAAGHALWGGTLRSRAVIATEYARHMIGLTVYYNLLLFGLRALTDKKENVTLEFDPRSSDFGKIVIGDTRLDVLAGEAQLATFAGRSITGETKSTTKGKVSDIRGDRVKFGQPTWWEVAGRFGASKLHPGLLLVGKQFAGVDLFGNEAALATDIGKMAGPITYFDIYQALKAQGIEEGTALSILAFLGEGLQTYQDKRSK